MTIHIWGVSQETDEDHPDWSHLQRALDAMINANSRINEFKRRKDLGEFVVIMWCSVIASGNLKGHRG